METLHLWFKRHSHCPFIFNIPLAARMSLQALQSVPTEQHQLAAQLNIKGFTFFRLIEWPYLKSQIVSAFILIFYAVLHQFYDCLGSWWRATKQHIRSRDLPSYFL